MEEKQVTLDGVKNPLPELFFVIATQNPVEYEGTYPLPETQLDRFMMKLIVTYPTPEEELHILKVIASERDLTHESPDNPLPESVATGKEPIAREGVRRDVEDAHDERALAPSERRWPDPGGAWVRSRHRLGHRSSLGPGSRRSGSSTRCPRAAPTR